MTDNNRPSPAELMPSQLKILSSYSDSPELYYEYFWRHPDPKTCEAFFERFDTDYAVARLKGEL